MDTNPGLNDNLTGIILLVFVLGLFMVLRYFQKKG